MVVSTKGRYALRIMLDIAEHGADDFVPTRDIAKRQNISNKYIEIILIPLSKAGLIEARRGSSGGHRLAKKPDEISVGEIIRLTEGDIVPVACLAKDAPECRRSPDCLTLPMWKRLGTLLDDFFNGYTLADLLNDGNQGNYKRGEEDP